jgi:DNA-binding MarR family transcriptional regulator
VKIWALTQTGRQIAATPSPNGSNGYRILAFLRRHGNQATSEQISNSLDIDAGTLSITMRKLEGAKVVSLVAG